MNYLNCLVVFENQIRLNEPLIKSNVFICFVRILYVRKFKLGSNMPNILGTGVSETEKEVSCTVHEATEYVMR